VLDPKRISDEVRSGEGVGGGENVGDFGFLHGGVSLGTKFPVAWPRIAQGLLRIVAAPVPVSTGVLDVRFVTLFGGFGRDLGHKVWYGCDPDHRGRSLEYVIRVILGRCASTRDEF
jgi:hypothetical protein